MKGLKKYIKNKHSVLNAFNAYLLNDSEINDRISAFLDKHSDKSLQELADLIDAFQYQSLMQNHFKNLIKAEDLNAKRVLTKEEKTFVAKYGRGGQALESNALYLPDGSVVMQGETSFVEQLLKAKKSMLVNVKPNSASIKFANNDAAGRLSTFNSIEDITFNSYISIKEKDDATSAVKETKWLRDDYAASRLEDSELEKYQQNLIRKQEVLEPLAHLEIER